MGEQAYIVTQSIKKLKKGEKESALNPQGFISEEAGYDGLYAVCTDLLDDEVSDILKVSEGRWQIEECFRIMKTDFSARPVYLQDENRIRAHFLICFLALTLYRFLEKKLDYKYTCGELLDTLKAMNFAEIQEQGFIPLYRREFITDALHEVCGFRTDYQFITKSSMRTIQKKVKGKNKLLYFVTTTIIAVTQKIQGIQRLFNLLTVKDRIIETYFRQYVFIISYKNIL